MTTELNASFSMFPATEKKSEKSPDFAGTIEIPVDQIDSLIAQLGTQPETNWKDEPVVKLRLAGWKNEAKTSGKKYIGGFLSVPMAKSDMPTQPSASTELDF